LIKTIVKAVRLPESLYDLVMICNPNKNFTEIVIDLLTEKYSFSSPCKPEEPSPCLQEEIKPSFVDPNFSVEEQVDDFIARKGKYGKKI